MMRIRELETPALLIDLDALEANIAAMQRFVSAAGVRLRPHTKTSKSPEIARLQARGGASGFCCAKLSEACIMADGGISDILVTTPVVGQSKIECLVALARRAKMSVVVDNVSNAEQISASVEEAGVTVGVYVELDVGQGRTGLADGAALADVAAEVVRLPGLSLGGMQAYNGAIQFIKTIPERRAAAARVAERIAAAKEVFVSRGLALPTVSGGGSGTVSFDIELAQLNELQAGSYIYMDGQYGGIDWPGDAPVLRPALSVLATVISAPSPERVVLDAGWKAVSMDAGCPSVIDHPDAPFEFGGDEHGILRSTDEGVLPGLGKKLELRPAHCDTTINLYDRAFGVRRGEVSSEIMIAARGCTQ